MAKYEEADVTVVSGKGQVVIPQSIRERLKIGPKTKLLVYGYGDAVIMKKMEIPDVAKDLQRLCERGYSQFWGFCPAYSLKAIA